jgi:hypothetical protein
VKMNWPGKDVTIAGYLEQEWTAGVEASRPAGP